MKREDMKIGDNRGKMKKLRWMSESVMKRGR